MGALTDEGFEIIYQNTQRDYDRTLVDVKAALNPQQFKIFRSAAEAGHRDATHIAKMAARAEAQQGAR